MPDYRATIEHRDGSAMRYRLRCERDDGWELKAAMIPLIERGGIVNATIEEGDEPLSAKVASDILLDTIDRPGMRPSMQRREALASMALAERQRHGL